MCYFEIACRYTSANHMTLPRGLGTTLGLRMLAKHAYRGGFDEYAIIEKRNQAARLFLEKYLIATLQPEGNKEIPRSRSELRELRIALELHRAPEEEDAELAAN